MRAVAYTGKGERERRMTRRWHFWLILIVIVIGLITTFWPAAVTDGAPAAATQGEKAVYTTDT